MAKSTRRPQQIFSIVMWVLSIIFAGFLIGLGSLVIRDIPVADRDVRIEQFIDADQLGTLTERRDQLDDNLPTLRRALEDAAARAEVARADYRARREAFDNWIATRSATESADTNPEVIVRTRELERLTDAIRALERDVEGARTALTTQQRAVSDVSRDITALRQAAQPAYQRALRAKELRVFGFRLLLTLPLLLVAGWMVARKRKSAYWPLYRGFVLFALFAFFVELVPYLPSYGGYVRFVVGIAVVLVSGYFLIKQMRRYLERKQAEEARSEVERRQNIDYETALKKIAAKTCPGCDRAIVTKDDVHTDYCVHCGIHLQSECGNCGTRNVTFHRFCLACGVANTETPRSEAPVDTGAGAGPPPATA